MENINIKPEMENGHSFAENAHWLRTVGDLTDVAKIDSVMGEAKLNQQGMALVQLHLSTTLSKSLMAFCKGAENALQVVAIATWGVLLQRLSENDQLVIATPAMIGTDQRKELLLRLDIDKIFDVRELLTETKQSLREAITLQSMDYADIGNMLQENKRFGPNVSLTSFCSSAVTVQGLQDSDLILNSGLPLILMVEKADGEGEHSQINLNLHYDQQLYCESYAEQLLSWYLNLLECILSDVNQRVSHVTLCSEQDVQRIVGEFNRPHQEPLMRLPVDKLVSDMSLKYPNKTALSDESEYLTYKQLHDRSAQYASYLTNTLKLQPESRVGLLIDRSCNCFAAILGIMKAGGAYVPLNPDMSINRLESVISQAEIEVVLSQSKHIRLLNNLQWQIELLKTFVCLDTDDVYSVEEAEKSELMSQQLWHFIGENAADDIEGGGWTSSYTGKPLSRKDMDEYQQNTYQKLKPYLKSDSRVLEIGCASGITMFRIAPEVEHYVGTDLSEVIINKNKAKVEAEETKNISLFTMPADAVDELTEHNFNIIIINSVIQDFHGHNYLRQVLQKCINLISGKGIIYVGDVMDQDRKQSLIDDLLDYKHNKAKAYETTKTYWDSELFVSRQFFHDYATLHPDLSSARCTDKQFTVLNELSKFRFDVVLEVSTGISGLQELRKVNDNLIKQQHDLSDVKQNNPLDIPERGVPEYEQLAYLIFTSGSTGQPKGAMIEHNGLINHALAKIEDLQITADDILSQNASLFFDISVWQYFSPLISGAQVNIYSDDLVMEPELFLRKLIADKVTILEVVPSYLAILLEIIKDKKMQFPALRYLMVTGETVVTGLINDWLNEFPNIPVVNAYGPTEASDDITHCILSEATDMQRIPVGKPVRNMIVTVRDRYMNLCPVGVKGEICVSGIGVGRGYVNDVEKTEKVFIVDDRRIVADENLRTYRTGDVGIWRKDGNLDFIGRKDNQVKIRGHRIELGDIEAALRKHPALKDVVVLTTDSADNNQLLAFFTSEKNFNAVNSNTLDELIEELKLYARSNLPEFMVPSKLLHLKSFPLTSNGKIDRNALFNLGICGSINVKEQPEGELEVQLRAVWASVLGIEPKQIGVTDDFFELGGNSINVLKVANRLSTELGMDVAMGQLFLKKTIKDLSAELQQESVIENTRCIIELNDSQAVNKAFFVHTADGTVYSYRGLAKSMAETHQVFGIQARGLVDNSLLPQDHHELMGEYLAEILRIQPEGPYLIGGHCMGAYISYELVRLLEDMGKDVQLIIMDVPASLPNLYIKYLRLKRKLMPPRSFLNRQAIKKDKYFYFSQEENINNQARENKNLPFSEWKAIIDDNINTHVNLTYLPKSIIVSPIIVVSSRESFYERLTEKEWRKMTLGDVFFEEIPGDHDSMFYPPNVSSLQVSIIAGLEHIKGGK